MSTVRLAGAGDAGPIADLMRASLDATLLRLTIYGCSGIASYLEDRLRLPPALTAWRHVVDGGHAAPAGPLAGCAEFRLLGDVLCLNYIAIAPPRRGAGQADRLLLRALDIVGQPRHRRVILDVFASNVAALGWYLALGFEAESENGWWSLPLASRQRSAAMAGACEVDGLPDACAADRRYGFSRFVLKTPGGCYRVGRLGRQWFKTDDVRLPEDEHAMACLALLDPARRILGLFPTDFNHARQGAAQRLDASTRMSIGLAQLRARLAERIWMQHGSDCKR